MINRRRRRSSGIVALVAAFTVVAAACTSDDSESSSEDSTEQSAPDEAVTTDAAPSTDAAPATDAEPADTAGDADEEADEETVDADPVASEVGITPESITIAWIAPDTSNMPDLPFVAEVDDPAYSTALLQALSGSAALGGRELIVEEFLWDPFSAPASLDEICLAIGDDTDVYVALAANYWGEAVPCLTSDKGVPLVQANSGNEALIERTEGNALVLAGIGGQLAADALSILSAEGLLETDSIALVTDGFSGNDELIAQIEPVLDELGIDARTYEIEADVLGTSPTLAVAVQNMSTDGIEFVYPFVNALNTAGLMNEADLLGFEPTWILTDHSERTTPLVPTNAPATQAANAIGVSAQMTDPSDPLTALSQACVDARNSIDGAEPIEVGSPLLLFVPASCQLSVLFEQIMSEAGVNPTRDGFIEAANALGSFDGVAGSTMSFAPGKVGAPDSYRIVEYSESCEGLDNGCFTPVSDWIVAPR